MVKKFLKLASILSDFITITGFAFSLFATNNKDMTLHHFLNGWFFAALASVLFTISVFTYYFIADLKKDVLVLKKQMEILDIKCAIYDILYNKFRSSNRASPYLLSPTDLSIVKSGRNEEYSKMVAQCLDDLFIHQKGIKHKDTEEYL